MGTGWVSQSLSGSVLVVQVPRDDIGAKEATFGPDGQLAETAQDARWVC